ncbi:precorrin-2 dehydrogenase/sirohydrochlorin ferrochelatase family protein [Mucisphaera sp.]|uniref:precorrin-2 dehydrogenase/sirohydrochlorin ferrochelatase family protein n=1 Tax=Mucisphaera sp. TaxID=2913024 RepID=UPI003D0FF714
MPALICEWDIRGLNCLVVGAGATGLRRARTLIEHGAAVTLIAPEAGATDIPTGCVFHRRQASPTDLPNRQLLVLATNDPGFNQRLAERARQLGIPTNRADDADAGDLRFLATRSRGPVTLAVSTGGASASAATVLAEQAVSSIEDHWIGLLSEAARRREMIQKELPAGPGRQALLRSLVDDAAQAAAQEGLAALAAHHDRLIERAFEAHRGEGAS